MTLSSHLLIMSNCSLEIYSRSGWSLKYCIGLRCFHRLSCRVPLCQFLSDVLYHNRNSYSCDAAFVPTNWFYHLHLWQPSLSFLVTRFLDLPLEYQDTWSTQRYVSPSYSRKLHAWGQKFTYISGFSIANVVQHKITISYNSLMPSLIMPSLHDKSSHDDGVIGINEALDMSSGSESNKPHAIAVDLDFKPNLRFYLSFVAISSLTLAAAIDATSVSNVLPIMTRDLQGSSIEAFWTGTSFLISSAIVMPIYATLSHVFGRKPVS